MVVVTFPEKHQSNLKITHLYLFQNDTFSTTWNLSGRYFPNIYKTNDLECIFLDYIKIFICVSNNLIPQKKKEKDKN